MQGLVPLVQLLNPLLLVVQRCLIAEVLEAAHAGVLASSGHGQSIMIGACVIGWPVHALRIRLQVAIGPDGLCARPVDEVD